MTEDPRVEGESAREYARNNDGNVNAWHRRIDGRIVKRWPPPPEGWEDVFFEQMAEHGVVTWSLAAAGVAHHRTVAKRRKRDPAFNQRWIDSQEKLRDKLKGEIVHRVFEGHKEEVYQQGKLVGYRTIKSDKLLMWLAERMMPETYHLASNSNINVDNTITFKFNMGEADEQEPIDVDAIEDVESGLVQLPQSRRLSEETDDLQHERDLDDEP